jgi:hypothetical protein
MIACGIFSCHIVNEGPVYHRIFCQLKYMASLLTIKRKETAKTDAAALAFCLLSFDAECLGHLKKAKGTPMPIDNFFQMVTPWSFVRNGVGPSSISNEQCDFGLFDSYHYGGIRA